MRKRESSSLSEGTEKILWGRAVVACKAHNLEVGGSTPPPATNLWRSTQIGEEDALEKH